MKLATAARQILPILQCIASGKTDTTGNLAYHVQEPDPEERMMKNLKKKKKNEEKRRNLVGKRETKILAFQWLFT